VRLWQLYGGQTTILLSLCGFNDTSKHGFHVHEIGSTADQCRAAGPHYNPDNLQHGAPTDIYRSVALETCHDILCGRPPGAACTTLTVDVFNWQLAQRLLLPWWTFTHNFSFSTLSFSSQEHVRGRRTDGRTAKILNAACEDGRIINCTKLLT